MSKALLKKRILSSDYGDFEYYVKELLKYSKLDGDAVVGIAKQITTQGVQSLTESQLDTFINYGLWQHCYVEECGTCSNEIPWSEMFDAVTEYGNCSYCQHILNKD
ncbi:hypothetical protein [Paenibacillus alvei]|uniref:Uncharacterized protein n=1 Tax=Paenibacillus alvei TaxID=44250 RepID=A0A383RC04_PAEAL|nr:hypothetical protein [Paenibacillus alvei]SYX84627.1 conserved protein of unknown function [Paenibacillus alvei]